MNRNFSKVQHGVNLSVKYLTGKGIFGGPRGTYGKYALGPVVNRWDLKHDRERQSGA